MILASDILQRIIDFLGGDAGGDKAVRDARRAMQDALNGFPGLHKWVYYTTWHRINLNAFYNTGTIEYDYSSNELTLTDGTWPSWAASGEVRINDLVSKVDTRDSDTVLTLDTTLRPAADIDAETDYVIYQDTYSLPADFVSSDAYVGASPFGDLVYVHSSDWLRYTRVYDNTGKPRFYTFFPDPGNVGRFALRIFPYPDEDTTLDVIYSRRPRAILWDGLGESGKGTATIAASSAAVTGSNTLFRESMIGSYMRFSRDTAKPPTDYVGVNPYGFQSKITAFTSTSSITLADQAPEAFTATKFTISDPLDIEDGTMATAFSWQAMLHAARALRMKDRPAIEQEAMDALVKAKEMDARNYSRDRAGEYADIRSQLKYYPRTSDIE